MSFTMENHQTLLQIICCVSPVNSKLLLFSLFWFDLSQISKHRFFPLSLSAGREAQYTQASYTPTSATALYKYIGK